MVNLNAFFGGEELRIRQKKYFLEIQYKNAGKPAKRRENLQKAGKIKQTDKMLKIALSPHQKCAKKDHHHK